MKAGVRWVIGIWLAAEILQIRRELRRNPTQWPRPAVLVQTALVYSLLGILAEVAAELAGVFAVGILIVILINDPNLLGGPLPPGARASDQGPGTPYQPQVGGPTVTP